ncbi:uncharacterized protein LOC112345958 [Selaginella moellendorffii]|uniref:uncharacterized protein LOC112345958 n=1 Tax=Selaginella moellendorffii TaxID=88036 RepID=UPI000D1C77E9|nr:uncharacterized protein LOC112345958 [Selaginella moellendorffii]|eukprot:XP_024529539.1 uncharacterized protein LOC112345958 [Selaginella moellendorffii]
MAAFLGYPKRRVFIHAASEQGSDAQILATKVAFVPPPAEINDISGLFNWLEARHQVEDVLTVRGWMRLAQQEGSLPSEFDLHARRAKQEVVPTGVCEWGDSLALKIAPSSINNENYMLLQGIDPTTGLRLPKIPAFSNYRPQHAKPPIPLTLAHPVFARFKDVFHGQGQQPDRNDYKFYLKIASAFSSCYTDEADYKDEAAELWKQYTGIEFTNELNTGGGTLGARLFALKAILAALEAKLGPFRSKSDPGAQAPQYVRLWKGNRKRFYNTCYPAISIEQLGTLVRVTAVATLDRFCCMPLTPFVNFLQLQGDDVRTAEQGVRLILAVKVALTELAAFYTNFESGPPRDLFFKRSTPYPLQNCAAVPRRFGDKLVYLVQHPERLVVVKFVQRPYGEDVHRAWAARGYAPELYGVSLLQGGWWQVKMQYLGEGDGWKVLQACPDADVLRPKVLEALAAAQQIPVTSSSASGEVGVGGGVHGDMRDVNVMVRRSADGTLDVKFIDFDWARAEGSTSAYYPPFMNHLQVNWQGGEDGKPMKQEHDTALLSLKQAAQSLDAMASPPSSSWGPF